jgi:hypothetical protein
MNPVNITKSRFDALCVIRDPSAEFFFPEREWWSVDNDRFIGAVCLDLSDETWAWMLLARDSDNLFRGISQGMDLETQTEASEALRQEMVTLAADTQSSFPQDDVVKPGNIKNLVELAVPAGKMSPEFRILIESLGFSPAKQLLQEFSSVFTDVDGNFVEQFQTSGFNSRLWELYLDLLLREEGFHRVKEYDRPDFCVIRDGIPIAIEAVTVNPSDKHNLPEGRSFEDSQKILEDFMPMRFSGPLNTKLNKRYWELPHMNGVPLIIAIQDFFAPASMTWSLGALRRYLYGISAEGFLHEDGTVGAKYTKVEKHSWEGKKLSSGFFQLPGAENISAVIANPSATLSKFNRMGKEAGMGDPRVRMRRVGRQWDPDPKSPVPIIFDYEVSSERPRERWGEGLAVFINHNAKNRLPLGFFDAGETHVMKEGEVVPYLKEGHIYSSQTEVILPPD